MSARNEFSVDQNWIRFRGSLSRISLKSLGWFFLSHVSLSSCPFTLLNTQLAQTPTLSYFHLNSSIEYWKRNETYMGSFFPTCMHYKHVLNSRCCFKWSIKVLIGQRYENWSHDKAIRRFIFQMFSPSGASSEWSWKWYRPCT